MLSQRGDVVAFRTKGLDGTFGTLNTLYVKRIVGLPGETIQIDPPYVMVNGKRMTEPPIMRKIAQREDGFIGFALPPELKVGRVRLGTTNDSLSLGPDEYMVLGDNGPNSLDSRFFGPVKRSAIVGKAWLIHAPTDRKTVIE